MENSKVINDLTDELLKASREYYNGGVDIMDDASYDDKANFLMALESQYPEFKREDSPSDTIGYKVVGKNQRVPHYQVQASLDKRYDVEEIVDFFEGKYPVIASYKGDGLTVVTHYQDGLLTDAVSRGDGEVGERLYSQTSAVHNVPKTIDSSSTVSVRSEAVIPKDMLAIINEKLPEGTKPYATCRNLASGTIRSLNPSVSRERGIQFMAFDLQECPEQFVYDSQAREWMVSKGFDIIPYKVLNNPEEIRDYIAYVGKIRNSIPYDIDGIVFGCDSLELRKKLGSTDKYPRYMLAYKFPNKGQVTTVTNIIWQVGRFSLTPVVTIEPIVFDGVTVTKATAHNANFVEGMDDKGNFVRSPLCIGSEVKIERSGEVIPKIAEVYFNNDFENAKLPTVCPVCGTVLERVGVELVCPNASCKGKIKADILYACSRKCLNIAGMGKSTVDVLVEHGLLTSVVDVFKLSSIEAKLMDLPGFGKDSVKALLMEIEHAKESELDHVINALGVKGIGLVTAKELACKLYPQPLIGLLSLKKEDMVSISGIGEVSADSIYGYLHRADGNALFYAFLYYEVGAVNTFAPVLGGSLTGKVFVVTGTLSKERKQVESDIVAAGGKVSSSVSAKTTYVVVGKEPGKSKMDAAISKGVPMISESELNAMF